MHWSFVPLNEMDIGPLLEVERSCFAEPWPRLSFSNEFNCTASFIFGARLCLEDGHNPIAGYICFRLSLDEMHIFKIAVAPRWQRLGIASRLLHESILLAFERGSLRAFLEVRQFNHPAVQFYKKNGFQIAGRRKRYYFDTGEDALVMIKHLEVML